VTHINELVIFNIKLCTDTLQCSCLENGFRIRGQGTFLPITPKYIYLHQHYSLDLKGKKSEHNYNYENKNKCKKYNNTLIMKQKDFLKTFLFHFGEMMFHL
jgi:hypothetical protein